MNALAVTTLVTAKPMSKPRVKDWVQENSGK